MDGEHAKGYMKWNNLWRQRVHFCSLSDIYTLEHAVTLSQVGVECQMIARSFPTHSGSRCADCAKIVRRTTDELSEQATPHAPYTNHLAVHYGSQRKSNESLLQMNLRVP